MSIRVQFHGGPADGIVREYPFLDIALPGLYWQGDAAPDTAAAYHSSGDAPDPQTGLWRYHDAGHEVS